MSSDLGGWIDDPAKVEEVMTALPFPVFSDVWGSTKGFGNGKKVLLYEYIRKASGGSF